MRIPVAVRTLLIVNVAIFLIGWMWQAPPGRYDQLVYWFACWFPRNEHFGVWQVVTYMFMHGGVGHIFFNMFALASFGAPLEFRWGTRKFLVFYFLCGVGAALIQTGINWVEFQVLYARFLEAGIPAPALESILELKPYADADGQVVYPSIPTSMVELYRLNAGHMVGASGAIYGVLVAFGLLYPNAKLALLFLPVPVAAKYFIPVLLGLDLFSGVTGFSLFGGGIAHFAHLGGALIGFLLMWYWRAQARRAAGPDTHWRSPVE